MTVVDEFRYFWPRSSAQYNHIFTMNSSYIDELEQRLANFSEDWEDALRKRITLWRVRLLLGVVLSLVLPVMFPSLHWLWLVVMGLSAGSLFALLKSNADMKKHVTACREHIRNARLQGNYRN